jgi:hypothetical protein
MKMIVAALIAITALTPACAQSAQQYRSADAVVAEIDRQGLQCDGMSSLGQARLVDENARCKIGSEDVQILVFKDEAALARWLPLGGTLGNLVVGPNWVIRAESSSLADSVAHALGGERM